ncbi:RNA-splicing ligase RtcB [Methanococcus maripaludis]|uniref:tRNA-splicing ligase RtcB n=1 Tax=Methanococcus maripaludis TaxID=39152 RepID=A0A7J9NWH3_METMI|nr:RtcB family protein [Methanococcus maripaludis]MBA2851614.1 RNA-splicing ligase RtcB [Methanococcus maripaludis]
MIEIKGANTTAHVKTDHVDSATMDQIREMCNLPIFAGCDVKIMPDTHAGKGSVIGFTGKLQNGIIPNIVGVDIGCGIGVAKIGDIDVDFIHVDEFITEGVPAGFKINDKPYKGTIEGLSETCKRIGFDEDEARRAIGSLGGGNHFIEIAKDETGCLHLLVHSGSRKFGKCVAEYHQRVADKYIEECKKLRRDAREREFEEIRRKYSGVDVEKHINEAIERHQKRELNHDKVYNYLCSHDDISNYMHDMQVACRFAELNREVIITKIFKHFGWNVKDMFHTVHNYVAPDGMIRKGAISARKGECLVIPINMRDGTIMGVGKGNPAWNHSAPHGAGRVLGRNQAKRTLRLADYKAAMEGIYTTSVSINTIDEAPDAYKPVEVIMEHLHETVDVVKIIKPVYNFKAD